MKSLSAALIAAAALSASPAHAWVGRRVQYQCTGGKTTGLQIILDTDKKAMNLIGSYRNADFDFWSKGAIRGNFIVWKDRNSDLEVRMQRPGPYDGDQDAFSGVITNGKSKMNLTCYFGNNSDY